MLAHPIRCVAAALFGSSLRCMSPHMDATDADAKVTALVKSTLLEQPGFDDLGKGVKLERLCELVEDDALIADDEDFERVYDACDYLEEIDGWLRIDGTDPEEDLLYLNTAAVAAASPSSPPKSDYDYAAEESAVAAVIRSVGDLKLVGLDPKGDEATRVELQRACELLALRTESSPSPAIREDDRLLGDWKLIGTTSPELVEREGITGLGKAPFTSPIAIFYRYEQDGRVVCKEVLSFFGNPVIVNELRGRLGFSEDGTWTQEQYSEADLSGQRNSANFASATSTSKSACMTSDGKYRLAFTPPSGFFVFEKLDEGAMDGYLMEKRLPLYGGTVATLDTEEIARAYPYLKPGTKP